MQNSFIEILSWRVWTFLEYFDAGYCGQYIPIIRLPLHIWTKGDPYNLDKLRQGYKDHNDHIRQLVPQERLLVWHPRDGWEPLCKHLGKPVPKEPVPKLNEGMYVAKLHQWVVTVRLLAVATKALKIAAPVAAAGLGLWCYRGM